MSTDVSSQDGMPVVYPYESHKPGKHVLALGAIHGSEPCGTIAIERLRHQLDGGQVNLQAGRLTLIPVCNPAAAAQGARFIDENLNRVFKRHAHPVTKEQALANYLCDQFDEADDVLDLHSTMAPSTPYAFQDAVSADSTAWIRAMGVPFAVTGWPELYPPEQGESSTGDYGVAMNKLCITVECGQNDDPAAHDVAHKILLNSLVYHGLTAGKAPLQSVQTARLTHKYTKEKEGRHARPFENFSKVVKGEPLIHYDDGQIVHAPHEGWIFLPKTDADIGVDWLYLAKPAI
jgi:predicted deacylase